MCMIGNPRMSYSSKKSLYWQKFFFFKVFLIAVPLSIIHANITIFGNTELTPYPYAMHDIAMYDIAMYDISMYDITIRNSLHQQYSASSQAEKWGHGEKAPSSL